MEIAASRKWLYSKGRRILFTRCTIDQVMYGGSFGFGAQGFCFMPNLVISRHTIHSTFLQFAHPRSQPGHNSHPLTRDPIPSPSPAPPSPNASSSTSLSQSRETANPIVNPPHLIMTTPRSSTKYPNTSSNSCAGCTSLSANAAASLPPRRR